MPAWLGPSPASGLLWAWATLWGAAFGVRLRAQATEDSRPPPSPGQGRNHPRAAHALPSLQVAERSLGRGGTRAEGLGQWSWEPPPPPGLSPFPTSITRAETPAGDMSLAGAPFLPLASPRTPSFDFEPCPQLGARLGSHHGSPRTCS